MKPNVRSLDGLLRICYDLPHRIHTSKAYPLQSPNGSTVIVYGHEQGLRFIWRGGRPFREEAIITQGKSQPNGASHDAIMIDDSSDEETANLEPFEDNPAFQDEDAEYDPSEPYEPIIQTLDLPLGVEVLHIAFPHLPPDLHRSSLPPLLSSKILVAVACSDCSIRVISLPLTPPSPRSKARPDLKDRIINSSDGTSIFGEQMLSLSSGATHQSIPNCVSISMSAYSLEDTEDVEMEDEEDDSQRLPPSRHASRSGSRSRLGRDQAWDILVASHSADLSGLLLVHRVSLSGDGTSLSTDLHSPWRVQYLASPAASIEFSSALFPAPLHSQLLVAEAKGVVRILDCLPNSKGNQGSWLLSLYTDFETSKSPIPKRKAILDARWILGGKAILVLQSDGNWVAWDHEGAGPKPTDAANVARHNSRASLGVPALQGWVGDSLKSKPLLKSSSTKNDSRSKLAPMTPSTRKMKQDALFTGPTATSDGPVKGGISVSPLHHTNNSRLDDESVLLWHGTNAIVIPSFFSHWQNKVRGSGNLFGSGAKGEPKAINNIQLGGEHCNEIGLIPNQQPTGPSKDSFPQPAILVTGEKRLLIICPPLREPELPAVIIPRQPNPASDQKLLDRGELDVNGMDRILNGMSNGHTARPNSQGSRGGQEQNMLSI